jgi:peroxiredoxin
MNKIAIQCMVYCLFSVVANAQSSGPLKINGTIKNIADVDKVVINYFGADKKNKVDTIKPENGKYGFEGNIGETGVIQLTILHPRSAQGWMRKVKPIDVVNLCVNPGTIEAVSTGEFNNIVVTGTGAKWNKDFQYISKQSKLATDSIGLCAHINDMPTGDQMAARPGYTAADKARDSALTIMVKSKDYLNIHERLSQRVLLPYIKANPGSPISLYALNIYIGDQVKMYLGDRLNNYQQAKVLFESLPNEQKKSALGQYILQTINAVLSTSTGDVAPVFSLLDTLGKPVSLTSFRGKYVLLDFWASWCGPCRQLNPEVLKLYNAYKDKGFMVLSVSVDANEASWKKAIVQDKLTWPQVRDAEGKVISTYHVTGYPQSFFINPEGKIIGRDLNKEQLEAKLKEITIKN